MRIVCCYMLICAAASAFTAPALAAETAPAAEPARDPLAGKQQIVRDRMVQLEDRMFRLTERLAKAEPEQAKRLADALRQARELLVRRNMDEIIQLLDQGQLTDASDRQLQVAQDLEKLLHLLLEDSGAQQRQEELDRLKAYRQQIDQLLEKQRQLKGQLESAESQPHNEEARRLLDQGEAARRQRELRQQTDDLARKMGAPAEGSGSQPAESGQPSGQERQQSPEESQEAQPQAPGAQNVQRAGGHMEDAAEGLDQRRPQEAAPRQQQAIDELEQARRELEETLDQLRKEQREETLRGLESRFRAMLAQQQVVNTATDGLIAKGPAAWVRADELTLAGLAQDEKKLADQAAQALNILTEDATTLVFPRVVEGLRDDMLAVSGRLSQRQADAVTQVMQADLITTLKDLIDAVKQMREELASGGSAGGGGGGGGGREPLLPGSAELKMLRSCQQRIKSQTAAIAKAQAAGNQPDGELPRIAERQKQIADMARKMNERITGQ